MCLCDCVLLSLQTNYLYAKNSDLNSNVIIQRPVVYPIDWTHHASEDPTVTLPAQIFDIILLTDCVFSVELVPDLMSTILKYTGPKTTVMVCHEVRDHVSLCIIVDFRALVIVLVCQ